MNTTKAEKTVKELLKGVCWEYLHHNFHKFNETNKIKIALAICTKDMPTELSGAIEHTHFFNNIVSKPTPNRIGEYVSAN